MPAAENIDDMWVRLLKEDPEARQLMLKEIHELIQAGEIETSKGMLRTLIKVTCGFPAISDEVGRNSKSIMRMLSPDVDPGIKAFMAIVKAAERQAMKCSKVGMMTKSVEEIERQLEKVGRDIQAYSKTPGLRNRVPQAQLLEQELLKELSEAKASRPEK